MLSVIFLVVWGLINLGVWFHSFRVVLQHDPNFLLTDIKWTWESSPMRVFLEHGPAIIGTAMLAFGVIGAVYRSACVITLEAVSMTCVGVWNLLNPIAWAIVMKGTGRMVEPSNFEIMLGAVQLAWGWQAFVRYWHIAKWGPQRPSAGERLRARRALESILTRRAESRSAVVEGTILVRGPLFMRPLDRTVTFRGQVCRDRVILMSEDRRDCFSADRSAVRRGSWNGDTLTLHCELGKRWQINLASESKRTLLCWLRTAKRRPEMRKTHRKARTQACQG